jgi:hypothetical protein
LKRENLEHVIRAAGAIAEANDLVILGTLSVLGKYPNAPQEILLSEDFDLYPLDDPEKAELIDGTIGEMSPFHHEFGYYAHGVGPETAVLPGKWRDRVVIVRTPNTHGFTGHCLHPADLAVSKLLAGREKDIRFVSALLRHGLVSESEIIEILPELSEKDKNIARKKLESCLR